MNYQQFVSTLNQTTSQLFESGITVRIHSALKNNGARRTGLTISQEGSNISPTIYLEEYYQQFQNGRNLEDIAQSLVRLYHEVKFEHPWEVNQVQDFQYAKSRLACKLIHFEKNQALLKDIPHVPYLDLAIVFFLLLETTEKGSATILITNDILEYWGVPLELLYRLAIENTPRLLQAECKPMQVVICELLGQPCPEEEEESGMYVLSNHHRHFGAACILYDRVLEDIGNQLNEDYYVLPSSIHEMIILPVSCLSDQMDLDSMITEINETQVSEEEVLSDHAYYFSRKENRLLPTR